MWPLLITLVQVIIISCLDCSVASYLVLLLPVASSLVLRPCHTHSSLRALPCLFLFPGSPFSHISTRLVPFRVSSRVTLNKCSSSQVTEAFPSHPACNFKPPPQTLNIPFLPPQHWPLITSCIFYLLTLLTVSPTRTFHQWGQGSFWCLFHWGVPAA